MTPAPSINTLFLDVGGVLLTNGWGRDARRRAAERFNLDPEAFEKRHRDVYPALEIDDLSLDEYLRTTVFCEPRPFTPLEFREFLFTQSRSHPEMLEFCRKLKQAHRLKVVAVSNEGRELNEYRVHRFELASLMDCFISSSFVHLRKPDPAIFRMALDISQAAPEHAAYVDDRPEHVAAARALGIHAIHHEDVASTRAALAALGLGLSP